MRGAGYAGIVFAFLFFMHIGTLKTKLNLITILTIVTLFGHSAFARGERCSSIFEGGVADYELSAVVKHKYLASGGVSNVYKVLLKDGRTAVYAQRKDVVLDDHTRKSISLSQNEKIALSKIDFEMAKQIVRDRLKFDFRKIGLSPLNFTDLGDRFFYNVIFQQAEMLLNYTYLRSLSNLSYKGKAIAPKAFGFIMDGLGFRNGTLTEYIPGDSLWDGVQKGDLSKKEIIEIINSSREQLKFLHSKGFVHGDLSVANIIYLRESDGSLTVRFIDFSSPFLYFGKEDINRNTPERDLEVFEKSIRNHLPNIQ